MISVLFYKLGALFARLLPQNLSEKITEGLVAVQYFFRVRSRRTLARNLRVALGETVSEKDLHDTARRVFSNFGKTIYYFLRLPYMDRAKLRARCDFNGIE